MNLVQKLEEMARDCRLWTQEGYSLPEADLRDLLLEAAKRIRQLENRPTVGNGRPYKRDIKGVDHGYRNFW